METNVITKNKTIQKKLNQLEQAGFKLKVVHEPEKSGLTGKNSTLPFKGVTTLLAMNESIGQIGIGVAQCSVKDEYNEEEGIRWAFKDAIRHLTQRMGRPAVLEIFNA